MTSVPLLVRITSAKLIFRKDSGEFRAVVMMASIGDPEVALGRAVCDGGGVGAARRSQDSRVKIETRTKRLDLNGDDFGAWCI